MKYFKFTQVDAATGISVNQETPKEGPRNPDVTGLEVLFQDQINTCFFYGQSSSTRAKANPENQCYQITLAELAEAVSINIAHLNERNKIAVYEEEKALRRTHLVGKYDETAAVAGIYKYEQAKAYLADPTAAAPALDAEALHRGTTTAALAQRIVDRHEEFRAKEAKIAGLRGKQLDRMEAFTFDAADPIASWTEFNKVETIGTQKRQVFEDGQTVEKDVPIEARYYGPELGARYAAAGS